MIIIKLEAYCQLTAFEKAEKESGCLGLLS